MAGEYDVVVQAVRVPGSGYVELVLESPELAQAVPGQFVHVLTPGTLRRPISFSRISAATATAAILFQVVGAGTAWLAGVAAGQTVNVLGPLGHGFPVPEPGRAWCVVGGGVGIPPLFAAVQRWGGQVAASAILGARTAAGLVMVEDFAERGTALTLTTDDGSRGEAGTVLGPFKRWLRAHPDGQVYACGPTPMLAGIAAATRGHRAFLALEQRMGCGIGACLACVVPVHGPSGPRYARVCSEGPVFAAERLAW
ncbi:MAG: dihydroorotate dehydrogenase electron transfer subunit [Thermaerobacter sp.]|nr:dihydroorotate dehydrogenase electron transfer subunit [Thermaerobacter sp.]